MPEGFVSGLRRVFTRKNALTLVCSVLVTAFVALVLFTTQYHPEKNRSKVQAAIVNLDKPAEINGVMAPMGRQFIATLVGEENENYAWQVTTREDAEKGLKSGLYNAVVTIPEDFSSSITSLATPEKAEAATIHVETAPNAKINDELVTRKLTESAVESFGDKYVTDTFLSQIFVGFKTLREGLSQAASGAHQLADGNKQLADGAEKLSSGSKPLRDGIDKIADGADVLAKTGTELADGAEKLAEGASGLASGLNLFETYTDKVPTEAELRPILDFVNRLRDLINSIDTSWIQDPCLLGGGPDINPSCHNPLFNGFIGINKIKQEVNVGVSTGDEIVKALPQLKDAVSQMAKGSSALKDGLSQYKDGVKQYTNGVRGLNDGIHQYADGVRQYTNGVDQLAGGTQQLADGAKTLAGGLDEAVDKLPNYTDSDVEKIKAMILTPIHSTYLTQTDKHSAAVFISFTLWFAAILNFMVFSVLPRRLRQSLRPSAKLTFQTLYPSFITGTLEALTVVAVSQFFLQLQLLDFTTLTAGAIFVELCFNMVMQLLAALFLGKNAGLIVAFVVGVSAFAVQQISPVPVYLQSLGDFLPISFGSSVIMDVLKLTSNSIGSVIGLIAYSLVSFTLTNLIITQRRKFKVSEVG